MVVGVAVGAIATGFLMSTDAMNQHTKMSVEGADMAEMDTMSGMEMMDGMDMAAMHEQLVFPPDTPVPTVAVQVVPDTKDGYNVLIETENFRFAPTAVNGEPIPNEGHAHVYVNGTKVGRVYSEWTHVEGRYFTAGENEVYVTLNANDHSEWAVDGVTIADTDIVLR